MSEAKDLEIIRGESGSTLPITKADFDSLAEQRKLLMTYVRNQLSKDVDYGIIPGTKKPTLYKPGAEKLRTLFTLEPVMVLVEKEFDRRDNFAMYTYKCSIKKNGTIIGECEASCNSQEKKYKERTVYVNSKSTKEPTPICDIINTLQKMAQKRAFVGAIILAVGASDFFNQDFEDVEEAQAIGVLPADDVVTIPKPTKVSNEAVKHKPPSDLGGYVVPIGRNKGKTLSEIDPEEIQSFISWGDQQENPGRSLKEVLSAATLYLESLGPA